MEITIHESITDNVLGAVWLGTLILTYQRAASEQGITGFAFKQSEIQRISAKLCTKTVHSPRISQWSNGDHPNSLVNYLRQVAEKRRLTRLGEFSHHKEYPERLLDGDVWVFKILDQEIRYKDLLEWYKTVYSESEIIKTETEDQIQRNDIAKPISETESPSNSGSNDILSMGFRRVGLQIDNFDQENLFSMLNSKTVEQTIKHPRYMKLAAEVSHKYPHHMHYGIGNFLFQLKLDGDALYKNFLNRHGDSKYCRFRLIDKDACNSKGLYYFSLNREIMYIGRCLNSFNSRFNMNYGNISPRNCYIDGQSTNCHLNSIINQNGENIELWLLRLDNDEEIIEKERMLIQKYRPAWNIAL